MLSLNKFACRSFILTCLFFILVQKLLCQTFLFNNKLISDPSKTDPIVNVPISTNNLLTFDSNSEDATRKLIESVIKAEGLPVPSKFHEVLPVPVDTEMFSKDQDLYVDDLLLDLLSPAPEIPLLPTISNRLDTVNDQQINFSSERILSGNAMKKRLATHDNLEKAIPRVVKYL
jgi:hypothetical protein